VATLLLKPNLVEFDPRGVINTTRYWWRAAVEASANSSS